MKKRLKLIFKEYFFLIISAFIFTSSIIQASIIPTGSMDTTIRPGDIILVNRLTYDFYTPRNIPRTDIKIPYFDIEIQKGPERGDIVVFDFPGYRDQLEYGKIESWVKRCVGLPGDTVQIIDRILFVNGKEFPLPNQIKYENYYTKSAGEVEERIFPKNSGWNEDQYGPLVIPRKGEIVNLNASNFYKYRMLINRDLGKWAAELKGDKVYIDGKLTNQYTVTKDYYFMVGDNRNNSLDSRYWGFVSRDRILGTPFLTLGSFDANIPFSQLGKLISSFRFNRIGKSL